MDPNGMFAAWMAMRMIDGSAYREIHKLDFLLEQAGIPHEMASHMMGGFQLVYYGPQGKPQYGSFIQFYGMGAVCSVMETPYSVGYQNDRLEISGLLTPEERMMGLVRGDLTAEDVFDRIRRHWLANAPRG